MHPLYLVDYICRIKRDLNNDVEYLRGGVDGIRAIETKYNELELNWLMTAIEREAHLLKHHIFQLEKYLEKITDNASKPIQDNVCGEHLPTEVCTRTK